MQGQTARRQRITITQDGVVAGDGVLEDGQRIENCPAVLGADHLPHEDGSRQEAAERVYEMIEATIAEGGDELTWDGHHYEWHIDDMD